MAQPDGALSGPSTVELPSGSQILNQEKRAIRPGTCRPAPTPPPSDSATSSQFSVRPSLLTTGVASLALCVPSSDEVQTSPLSMYATDAAPAPAGTDNAAAVVRSRTARRARADARRFMETPHTQTTRPPAPVFRRMPSKRPAAGGPSRGSAPSRVRAEVVGASGFQTRP